MKKRIFAILLSFVAALSLVACKTTTSKPDPKSYLSSNEGKSQEEINAELNEMVENFKQLAGPSFELGTVTDYTYTNSSLGIGIQLDDTWLFKTKDEIDALNSETLDYVVDENQKSATEKAFEKGTAVTDMLAQNQETGDTVQVSAQDLSIVGSMYTVEQYAQINVDPTKSMLEKMGYSNIDIQVIDNDTHFGQTGSTLAISCDVTSDLKFYERCFIFKKGNVFILVTICSVTEGKCDELLDMFYEVSAE